jgi:type I restriction enzyme S subunit
MIVQTKQSKIKKTPKLRFPGFSVNWDEKKLGAVAKFFSGGTPSSSNKDYYSGKIPFIKSGEISKTKTEQFISREALCNSSAKEVNEGDLLYALYGATSGAVALSKIAGAINQAVLCIRTVENKKWLFSYLSYNKGRILAKYLQGGQGNLSADIVKKIKIIFPPADEQQKIADFIGFVDAWIENLRAQKKNLESYKKGMMQKIFSQEIRFRDDEENDFPEWEETRLGMVSTFYKGHGISKEDIAENGQNKCIRYGELYTEYNEIISEVKSKTDVPITESLVSKKNDLLIPSSGETSLDIASVSCLEKDGVLLGGDMNVLRLQENQSGAFFAFYLTHFKNKDIAKLAQGRSVVHLYSSYLKALAVSLPTFLEQRKIARFLIAIDKLIESKQQQIIHAEQWKKGLMQGLFV